MADKGLRVRVRAWRRQAADWALQADAESGWARRLVSHQLRLWRVVLRQFGRDKLGTVAGDLTFKTLLSLIPVLVIVALVVDFFTSDGQLGRRVLQSLFESLHIDALQITVDGEQVEAAAWVNDLVATIRQRISAAAAVGLVFLFGLAVNMLSTMETAMNRIWSVSSKRSLWRKLTMFWLVLTLGPPLAALAVHLSGRLAESTASAPVWLTTLGRFGVELLAVWAVLVLLYRALPNTRVRWWPALVGALVAGTLWHLVAKNAFALYVDNAVNYRQIYGSLALLPLFLLWVHLTWVLLLVGSELAFVVQYTDELDPQGARIEQAESSSGGLCRPLAAVLAAVTCCGRFQRGQGASSLALLARAARSEPERLAPDLERLVAAGLLAGGCEQDHGYLPGRPAERIRLGAVVDAVAAEPSATAEAAAEAGASERGAQDALVRRAARLVWGDRETLDQTPLSELLEPSPAEREAAPVGS